MNQSLIKTRFAPSPSGSLHIGGARTALFNLLYAKHHGGKFLLRIEDTDDSRHSEKSVQSILNGLRWLGINHDDNYILQSSYKADHQNLAHKLLACGQAFYCFDTKTNNQANFEIYRSPWRDKQSQPNNPNNDNQKPVIRFKVPILTQITFNDQVAGKLSIQSSQIDDFVIVRSDGHPTYPLAVVHDDHKMNITNVIRGTDHITNTFKQILIYRALGWHMPQFAHIPLIHDEDGKKLSKRLGALSVYEYKNNGYLSKAIINYILRLSWSHGNEEIISLDNAIKWFDIAQVSSSTPKLNQDRLLYLNHFYMQHEESLLDLALPFYEQLLKRAITKPEVKILTNAMHLISPRARTLTELAASSLFLLIKPNYGLTELQENNIAVLRLCCKALEENPKEPSKEDIKNIINQIVSEYNFKKPLIFQSLRMAIIGYSHSMPIADIIESIGKNETIKRLKEAIEQ